MSVSRDSEGMPLNTGYRPANASTRQTIISARAPVDAGFAVRCSTCSFVSVATIERVFAHVHGRVIYAIVTIHIFFFFLLLLVII